MLKRFKCIYWSELGGDRTSLIIVDVDAMINAKVITLLIRHFIASVFRENQNQQILTFIISVISLSSSLVVYFFLCFVKQTSNANLHSHQKAREFIFLFSFFIPSFDAKLKSAKEKFDRWLSMMLWLIYFWIVQLSNLRLRS